MIHYLVPDGFDSNTIRGYLAGRGASLAHRLQVVTYESLLERRSFDGGTYVFSALDRLGFLNPPLLAIAVDLHAALVSRGVRTLNHPVRTLRRCDLLAQLHTAGRNSFRAWRIGHAPDDVRFPVFLRQELSHDGALTPLLHSRAQVDEWTARLLLRGTDMRDLLEVEFCDTRDEAGFFRKYAAQRVGNRIIARSLNYGRNWMLKQAESEVSRAQLEEERDYVFGNPHETALREIFDMGGVDYGRIDYALLDGRIQTWEINVNPTVGRAVGSKGRPLGDALQPLRDEMRQHSHRLFREAWEAIDTAPVGTAFAVSFDVARIDAARRQIAERARGDARSFVRRAASSLGPLRPMVRLAVGVLLPVLAQVRALLGRDRARAVPRSG